MERREIYYQGRVQGVGFRDTARRIARRFAVTGYVKNLPDGDVELVAEGSGEELDAFSAGLEAEMRRYIRGKSQRQRPATGEFANFSIQF